MGKSPWPWFEQTILTNRVAVLWLEQNTDSRVMDSSQTGIKTKGLDLIRLYNNFGRMNISIFGKRKLNVEAHKASGFQSLPIPIQSNRQ